MANTLKSDGPFFKVIGEKTNAPHAELSLDWVLKTFIFILSHSNLWGITL